MSKKSNSIYTKPLLFSVVTLVVILVGSIVTAFYPLARDEMHPKLDTLKSYTALELAGRDIYQREGCSTCHTQTVRPLKSDVLRYGEYSKAGESAGERPYLWGSRRTGPDLARVGGKYMDEWHRLHFNNPRDFYKKSNMPAYAWLTDVKLNPKKIEAHMKGLKLPYTGAEINNLERYSEMNAIVAYVQVIGSAVERSNLVEVTDEDFEKNGNPAAGKPGAVAIGRTLFESECASCHVTFIDELGARDLSDYGTYIEEDVAFITVSNGIDGMMPSFINVMSREQVGSIVEYLKTKDGSDEN